jgi:SnoaL-like protein
VTSQAALRDWLDRYEVAWRSNDAGTIRGLFTEDAVYRWHPWDTGDDVAHGIDAIVAAWLGEPDDPDAWEFEAEPLAVDGDLGVARCRTVYHATAKAPRRVYHNVFLLRLTEDGRCRDFDEYYMQEPAESRA